MCNNAYSWHLVCINTAGKIIEYHHRQRYCNFYDSAYLSYLAAMTTRYHLSPAAWRAHVQECKRGSLGSDQSVMMPPTVARRIALVNSTETQTVTSRRYDSPISSHSKAAPSRVLYWIRSLVHRFPKRLHPGYCTGYDPLCTGFRTAPTMATHQQPRLRMAPTIHPQQDGRMQKPHSRPKWMNLGQNGYGTILVKPSTVKETART